MNKPLPPIIKNAERLLCDIEQAVRSFARFHKYGVGSDLRAQARLVVRICHRTWRNRQMQMDFIDDLIETVDEMKVLLQMGSQLHAFKSFSQFESLIRLAEDIGGQAGGWKRYLHRNGQNSPREDVVERAKILSGQSASDINAGAKL